eukprot:TRINITY_DN20130_c0_g1_i1.p1 TRINITY_DN20130_c0_g1~~TRINITY_DN20130_c0_g1_i1.p1  ORF type:complete len:154 (-),score=19.72 TRINITY_DN20130_c0_g1_i1:192-653(-)
MWLPSEACFNFYHIHCLLGSSILFTIALFTGRARDSLPGDSSTGLKLSLTVVTGENFPESEELQGRDPAKSWERKKKRGGWRCVSYCYHPLDANAATAEPPMESTPVFQFRFKRSLSFFPNKGLGSGTGGSFSWPSDIVTARSAVDFQMLRFV